MPPLWDLITKDVSKKLFFWPNIKASPGNLAYLLLQKAARDKCLNILNFNTQKSFKGTSVSGTRFSSGRLNTKGERRGEKLRRERSCAAFSGQSTALSAVWESYWISLWHFYFSFPVAREVNPSNWFYMGGWTRFTKTYFWSHSLRFILLDTNINRVWCWSQYLWMVVFFADMEELTQKCY